MTDRPSPFPTLTLADLIDLTLPDVEWVVDNLIPTGSFTEWVAREKAGKSLQAVDLACSVALGEPFLERAVMQGPVLFVPAEENIREVRARIVDRLNGRADADLHILPVNGFTEDELRLDDGLSLARLLATIEHLQPVLVILDPLRELHQQRENDSDAMGPLLRPVRQIAHHTNAALVINHHSSRMGGSRGSTAIKASFDQEIWFKRKDEDKPWESVEVAGVLRVEGRFGPAQLIGIRLAPHLRWLPSDVVLVPEGASTKDRVLALLDANPAGLTTEELAAKLNVPKTRVQNNMSDLVRERPCRVAWTGAGSKAEPRRYRRAAPFAADPDMAHEAHVSDVSDPKIYRDTIIHDSRSPRGGVSHEPFANGHSRELVPVGARVYVCGGCGLPRSRGPEPCPACAATGGYER